MLGRDAKDEEISQKTLRFLEWPELCKRLSEHALSPLGVGLCQSLLPAESEAEAARQIQMTSEMTEILEREGSVPLAHFEDLGPILDKAERGERLSGAELRQVSEFLKLVEKSRSFFFKRAMTSPVLWDLACLLQEIPYLQEALERAHVQVNRDWYGPYWSVRFTVEDPPWFGDSVVVEVEELAQGGVQATFTE
ncbi:MAG: hypothetical protein ACUVXD_17150, partial [Thermodesulfobacteriota bacterium]